MMGVPAISYRAVVNEDYDYGFYILPNKLSHQCFDFEQLRSLLKKILNGQVGAADGDDRRAMIKHYLTAQEGPLACERMVDVLETIAEKFGLSSSLTVKNKLTRWLLTQGLHMAKKIKSHLPGSHNRPEFQRHRYPGISLENLQAKLNQLQQLRGNHRQLKVEEISNVMFQIRS